MSSTLKESQSKASPSAPVPPEFLVPLADVTCDSGESVTLRCKVCGRPRATVAWKGPDQSNLANNGRFSIAYRSQNIPVLTPSPIMGQ